MVMLCYDLTSITHESHLLAIDTGVSIPEGWMHNFALEVLDTRQWCESGVTVRSALELPHPSECTQYQPHRPVEFEKNVESVIECDLSCKVLNAQRPCRVFISPRGLQDLVLELHVSVKVLFLRHGLQIP